MTDDIDIKKYIHIMLKELHIINQFMVIILFY